MDSEYKSILKKIEGRNAAITSTQLIPTKTIVGIAAAAALIIASSSIFYKLNRDQENEDISQLLYEASNFDSDYQEDVIYTYTNWVEFSEATD